VKTAKALGFTMPRLAADRIIENDKIAAVHESAFGTKRTSQQCFARSAFGGKADMVISELHVCF
jgi:hypothetical protein